MFQTVPKRLKEKECQVEEENGFGNSLPKNTLNLTSFQSQTGFYIPRNTKGDLEQIFPPLFHTKTTVE